MFDLRATLLKASEALRKEHIEHALIGGFALAFHGINRATADVDFLADGTKRSDIIRSLQSEGDRRFAEKIMTIEDYFEFLRQYWVIFGPPPEPPKNTTFTKVLI